MTTLSFYHWSPEWRDKPQTHQVMMMSSTSREKGATSSKAVSIATCVSAAVAKQIAELLQKDYEATR